MIGAHRACVVACVAVCLSGCFNVWLRLCKAESHPAALIGVQVAQRVRTTQAARPPIDAGGALSDTCLRHHADPWHAPGRPSHASIGATRGMLHHRKEGAVR